MKKSFKYPVGYIFRYENITLKVVENSDGNCDPCYFKNISGRCNLPCVKYERMDDKTVCFEEINTSKNM